MPTAVPAPGVSLYLETEDAMKGPALLGEMGLHWQALSARPQSETTGIGAQWCGDWRTARGAA